MLLSPLTRSPASDPKLIDRSSGRTETTSHTIYQNSEATVSRVTYCTYLLPDEQGLHINRIDDLPRLAQDSTRALSVEANMLITIISGVCEVTALINDW